MVRPGIPATVGFLMHLVFAASNKSLHYFWELILWMLSVGRRAIPPLLTLLAKLVVVLSSSIWVVGFLEAIWRWSLKPIS